MQTATALFVLSIALPFLAGIWAARKSAGSRVERLLLALWFPCIGFTIWLTCVAAIVGATSDWSGAKLAPIVAMVRGSPHGYPLYQDPSNGVLTGWVYGPVPSILFLAAAIWSTPTAELLTAMVINLLCILVPTVWIISQIILRAGSRQWTIALAISCAFLLTTMDHMGLYMVLFITGADAPAIGLAACSCAVLMGGIDWKRLALSAFFAVLAVWSKQTLLPFLAVAPLYLWLIGRRREISLYLAILASIAAGVSIILILIFGPLSNMWFHMVTLNSANPWQVGKTPDRSVKLLSSWLHGLSDLLSECAISMCVLLAVLVITRVAEGWTFTWGGLRQWATSNSWVVLLLAALVLSPAAVLGASIVGGFRNHIALCSYFLTLSASIAVVLLAIRSDGGRLRLLARLSITFFMVLRVSQIALEPGRIKLLLSNAQDPGGNMQRKIFDVLKQRPRLIYFPWQPLPALLAEGRLYHFEWGAIDRDLAGVAVGSEQLQNHLPEGAQFIAFRVNSPSRFMLKYCPQATQQVSAAELPGFALYSLPVPAQALSSADTAAHW